TGGEIRLAEVVAFLVLDGVGVLQSTLDLALAGAADSRAAFEWDAALLADRGTQQVSLLGDADDLVVVSDEHDGERHQRLTSFASTAPLPASWFNSARAFSSVAKRGRNFDGTRLTTGLPASSTMRIFTSCVSSAITK